MEGITATLVALPEELKIVIAGLVLAAVYALLNGRVPDEALGKIAVAVSTAVIAIVEVVLSLIPLAFEPVAVQVLQLIVVLLGWLVVKNLYFIADNQGLLE